MVYKTVKIAGQTLFVCSHTGATMRDAYVFPDSPLLRNCAFLDWNCMISYLLSIQRDFPDNKKKKTAIDNAIAAIHVLIGLDFTKEAERIFPAGFRDDLSAFGGDVSTDEFVAGYKDARHLVRKPGYFVTSADIDAAAVAAAAARAEQPKKKRRLNVVIEDDGEEHMLVDGDVLEDHMQLVEESKGRAKVVLDKDEAGNPFMFINQNTKASKKTIALRFV